MRYAHMTDRRPARILRVSLAVLLVTTAALAGCSPAKAEVRVIVSDPDGGALTGVTVTIGGQSTTTDMAGWAAFTGLQPGQVTITVTAGPDRELSSSETITGGPNSFAYTLEPAYQTVGLSDLARLRMRLTVWHDDTAEIFAQAAIDLENDSAHWDFGDGELLVLEGQAAYLKHDGHWTLIDGYIAEAVADIYAAMAFEYLAGFQMTMDHLGDAGLGVYQIGNETTNGYVCRVYEATWTESGGSLTYTVHVIASGMHAGRVTRYVYDYNGMALQVTDIWDFNGEFRVQAPF